MTIHTHIPATSDDTVREQVDALKLRAAALVYASKMLSDLTVQIYKANKGDTEARKIIDNSISEAMAGLGVIDGDLIDRLNAQLHADEVDIFELPRIGFDALNRSYNVESRAQKISDDAENAAYVREKRERREKQRRTGYTIAYEAAMRLTAAQRRQLAEAIIS